MNNNWNHYILCSYILSACSFIFEKLYNYKKIVFKSTTAVDLLVVNTKNGTSFFSFPYHWKGTGTTIFHIISIRKI